MRKSAAPPLPQLPRSRAVVWIATAFGAGLLPRAPGTFGTAVAVPLALALDRSGFGNRFFIAMTVGITIVGTFAADAFCRAVSRHDDQRIVIDEVAGYLVTLWAVERTPLHLGLAFLLFRLFDIWKPPPIRWIDRRVKGGFGVMADDLAAGAIAGGLLFVIAHYHLVARFCALAGTRAITGGGP